MDFHLGLSGHYPALLVVHEDRAGVIASVSNALAAQGVNIAHMEVWTERKRGNGAYGHRS